MNHTRHPVRVRRQRTLEEQRRADHLAMVRGAFLAMAKAHAQWKRFRLEYGHDSQKARRAYDEWRTACERHRELKAGKS
jgi:hypothetical protein